METSQNTSSAQYFTVNTSIDVQHIQLCVQVNPVKQSSMQLAYSAVQ